MGLLDEWRAQMTAQPAQSYFGPSPAMGRLLQAPVMPGPFRPFNGFDPANNPLAQYGVVDASGAQTLSDGSPLTYYRPAAFKYVAPVAPTKDAAEDEQDKAMQQHLARMYGYNQTTGDGNAGSGGFGGGYDGGAGANAGGTGIGGGFGDNAGQGGVGGGYGGGSVF